MTQQQGLAADIGSLVPTRYSREKVGAATVASLAGRLYNYTGRELKISKVHVSAGTAPTGADLIVDVNKNGTTIFTTQSARPKVVAGSNSGVSTNPAVTVLADGDYLTVDIDQIGSTVAGSDVIVSILAAG